jgi:hypothetical protein
MGIAKAGKYKAIAPGSKNNRLTVLEELPRQGRCYYLRCRCDCGTETVIRKDGFTLGHTKSCGCLNREVAREYCIRTKRGKPGWSNFSTVYTGYKHGAIRRNLIFDISKNDFFAVSQQPCFYCCCPPSNIEAKPQKYGSYVYNGLDRLDNKAGYTVENVVSACWPCNHAKGNLSVAEFAVWIRRVHSYQQGGN